MWDSPPSDGSPMPVLDNRTREPFGVRRIPALFVSFSALRLPLPHSSPPSYSAGIRRTPNASRLTGNEFFGSTKTKSRTCIRLLVMTRFIRLHPGAQKGDTANYLLAVRTASQAKPLY